MRVLVFDDAGRRGRARYRRILGIRNGRQEPHTTFARLFLRLLDRAGLPEPESEHVVALGRGVRYRVDAAYVDRRIAIELDGKDAHQTAKAFEGDRVRDNRLEIDGWVVLRYTWLRFTTEPDEIVAEVRAALARRAELYLFDEPTSGLDPLMEAEFREVVLELKHEGATVLLSSHILAEAEALSDRISIIRAGRVVQSGSLAELRHLTRTTVIAETASPPNRIGEVEGVHNPQVLDGRVTFDVDSDHLDDAVRALAALGVRSLTAHPPTLEELFLRQYGEEVSR